MSRKLKVTWFQRKPYDFHFSLEKLFNDLRPYLEPDIELFTHTSPYPSQGFLLRIKNLIAARKAQGEVNHVLGDIHYLVPGLSSRRTILTIHDLGFMKHPSRIARLVLRYFWLIIPVKHATLVTVISESTKKDLLHYIPSAKNKIRVIPDFLTGNFPESPKPFNQERPRLLQIGTKFNKNLERLIPALEGLPVELSIVGKLSEAQLAQLQRHNIIYYNYYRISEEELYQQYQWCDLLVFCSTLEGFGLPILEAQSVGRPVVTSNCSSMPEIAGNGACLVDPFNSNLIRVGILKVIEDMEYRNGLIREGRKNLHRFSKEKVASLYLKLYMEVYNAGWSVGRG
jgi:glycosyltransferase involved in cell wall biosynthesis